MASDIADLIRAQNEGFRVAREGVSGLAESLAKLRERKEKHQEVLAEQRAVDEAANFFEQEASAGRIPNVPTQYAAPIAGLMRRMGKTTFGTIMATALRDRTPAQVEAVMLDAAMDMVDAERTEDQQLALRAKSKMSAALNVLTKLKDLKSHGGSGGGVSSGDPSAALTKGISGVYGQVVKSELMARKHLEAYKKLSPEEQNGPKGQELLRRSEGFTRQAELQKQAFEQIGPSLEVKAKRNAEALSSDTSSGIDAELNSLFGNQ